MPTDLRTKDISDWAKIILMLLTLGAAWGSLHSQLADLALIAKGAELRAERVEMYLSSKDSHYWETVRAQSQPSEQGP